MNLVIVYSLQKNDYNEIPKNDVYEAMMERIAKWIENCIESESVVIDSVVKSESVVTDSVVIVWIIVRTITYNNDTQTVSTYLMHQCTLTDKDDHLYFPWIPDEQDFLFPGVVGMGSFLAFSDIIVDSQRWKRKEI